MIGTLKKHLGSIAAYLAAGLVMIYLSYSLPRLLPGDFVTAMYSSSHVTLNASRKRNSRRTTRSRKASAGI